MFAVMVAVPQTQIRAKRIMLSEETPGSYPRSMLGVSVYINT